MRRQFWSIIVTLSLGLGVRAQLPPASRIQEVQQVIEGLAQKQAEDLAMLAKSRIGGLLNPDVDLAFRRVGEAVRIWKKEKSAGAAPLLAEGVLLDCLGRLHGVTTRLLPQEPDKGPFADVAAARLARAAEMFEAALRIDPTLVEARMRAARIRALKDPRSAIELENIAGYRASSPLSYLAAMSRAAVAHGRGELVTAVRWFERSIELNPRSTAARIALSSLRPAAPPSLEVLDPEDLYYTYPCSVLTANINAALAERVKNVVLK